MISRYLKYILIGLVFVFILSMLFYFYQINVPISKDTIMIDLEISSGESTKQIATELKSSGIIRNIFWMRVYFKLNNLSSRLIADTFSVSPSMSIKQIGSIITSSSKEEIKITVIEGWNAKQIGDYLEKQNICSSSEWLSLTENYNGDYSFLKDKPINVGLEGYLFPDTYIIYKNASCETILDKMLKNFGRKINQDMMSEINRQGKNLFEVLTLASIIELEVPISYDRKMIADIFLKRLDEGIALQSDATINYITGNAKTQPSYNETRIESPYNTYLNRGLPPAPISNPGFSAIEAVVYPELNPYYYFLTTDSGEVKYSKTYDEHLRNKAKYLD